MLAPPPVVAVLFIVLAIAAGFQDNELVMYKCGFGLLLSLLVATA